MLSAAEISNFYFHGLSRGEAVTPYWMSEYVYIAMKDPFLLFIVLDSMFLSVMMFAVQEISADLLPRFAAVHMFTRHVVE